MSDLPHYHPYAYGPFWDFVASIDGQGDFAGHPFAAAYGPRGRGRGNRRPGNPTWGRPWNANRRRTQEKPTEPQSAESSDDDKMPPTPSTVEADQEKGLGAQEMGSQTKRSQFNQRVGRGRGPFGGGIRGRGGRRVPNAWKKGQDTSEDEVDQHFHPITVPRMRNGRPLFRKSAPITKGGPSKFGMNHKLARGAPPAYTDFYFINPEDFEPVAAGAGKMNGKGKGKGNGLGKGKGKKGPGKMNGKGAKAAGTVPAVPNAKAPRKAAFKKDFTPPVDVFDTTGAYILHFSLPGAKRDDITVNWNANNSHLRVRGEVQRPADETMLKCMTKSSRPVGVFGRAVKLGPKKQPARIYPQGISAKLEEGILKVEVPKEDKEYPEKVVEVNTINVQ